MPTCSRQCYIASDAACVDLRELERALEYLSALPAEAGYFTETFCIASRFFQPHNGARIDAIRGALQREFGGSPLFPILLTSLIEAADRVDSTTGVQMAYVKEWAPRSYNPLELRVPELLPGAGVAVCGDALDVAATLGPFDIAYLDPPYNQHRYFTNYHIWETLVAWDAPEHYGVACKRVDAKTDDTKSPFNQKRAMPAALRQAIVDVDAELLVVSYNNEAWITLEELEAMCAVKGSVVSLAFESNRYVGAKIGIYNPSGEKVGAVSHVRNLEYVVISGDESVVARVRDRELTTTSPE